MKLFVTKDELVVSSKHMFAHFSAAFCNNERRKLVDDFQECCVEYDFQSDLLAKNNTSWFFGVYQKMRLQRHLRILIPVSPELQLIVIKTM